MSVSRKTTMSTLALAVATLSVTGLGMASTFETPEAYAASISTPSNDDDTTPEESTDNTSDNDDNSTDSTNPDSTDSGERCINVSLNVALVVDNSISVEEHPELQSQITDSYKKFVETAQYIDPAARITVFPVNIYEFAPHSFYSNTFDLSKEKDKESLNDIIDNWEFKNKEGQGPWVEQDELGEDYFSRGDSDFFSAVQRVDKMSEDKGFNLMVTTTDGKVMLDNAEGDKDVSELGKSLRDKGVTIKSFVGSDNQEDIEKFSDPNNPVAQMTSDNPREGKDFFTVDSDTLGDSLSEVLNDYCLDNGGDSDNGDVIDDTSSDTPDDTDTPEVPENSDDEDNTSDSTAPSRPSHNYDNKDSRGHKNSAPQKPRKHRSTGGINQIISENHTSESSASVFGFYGFDDDGNYTLLSPDEVDLENQSIKNSDDLFDYLDKTAFNF